MKKIKIITLIFLAMASSVMAEPATVMQVQDEINSLPFFEKRKLQREEAKMTSLERQQELADEIDNTKLDENIINTSSKNNTAAQQAEDNIYKMSAEQNVIISIEDCVKLALMNNPDIRYAMSNSDIYKSKIAQAWSAYFPTFSLGTNYSRNKFLPVNFKPPITTYNLWNSMALEGSQLIYDFGKTQTKVGMAKKTHEATLNDLQSAINQTVYAVKSAYFEYLYTLKQEHVMQTSVEMYEKHYKQALASYDAGIKSKIDVVTAEYNLSNAKLEQIKAKHQAELAQAKLNNAMGLPRYSNYSVTEKLEMLGYNLNFDELINSAYDVRPELLAVKNKSEASNMLISASKKAFAPDLQGFGSYTAGGKTYTADYGYQLGLRLSYPTTNFFMLKHQVNEAKYTHQRDMAELDKKAQEVFLDVKSAYIEFLNSMESVPVAHKAMNEAKLQYEIAAGRYKSGLGDAVELKDAENTYKTAQLNYYSTLMNYNTSVANIERVVGTPIKSASSGEMPTPEDFSL